MFTICSVEHKQCFSEVIKLTTDFDERSGEHKKFYENKEIIFKLNQFHFKITALFINKKATPICNTLYKAYTKCALLPILNTFLFAIQFVCFFT